MQAPNLMNFLKRSYKSCLDHVVKAREQNLWQMYIIMMPSYKKQVHLKNEINTSSLKVERRQLERYIRCDLVNDWNLYVTYSKEEHDLFRLPVVFFSTSS